MSDLPNVNTLIVEANDFAALAAEVKAATGKQFISADDVTFAMIEKVMGPKINAMVAAMPKTKWDK